MQGEQRPGDYKVCCDRSGFVCWASETVMEEGTGLRVHRRFADKKHPQDDVRGVRDNQSVPNPRPEAPDTFITDPITAADL